MRTTAPRLARSFAAAPVVGADWGASGRSARPRRSHWSGLVAVLLVAAFSLVVLRVEQIRMQYSLAEAIAREDALLAKERELTVSMRRLRHPGRLSDSARYLGFITPERVIHLETQPAPGSASTMDHVASAAPPTFERRP